MIDIGIHLRPSEDWRTSQSSHSLTIDLSLFRLNHDSFNLLLITSKWLDLNRMRLFIDDIFFFLLLHFSFFLSMFRSWKFPLSCLGMKIIGKRRQIYSKLPELDQSVET